MKTAVIYTGQARTFAQTHLNHYWHVLRKLPNPEFFVSVARDAQAPDMAHLIKYFPPESVHIETVQQPQIPEPVTLEKWRGAYPPSSSPQAILRQLWALGRGWEFFRQRVVYEDFDQIMRIRPDLVFARVDLPKSVGPLDCFTPYWARWGGVNDRFAVMGHQAARHYFNAFDLLDAYIKKGCPLHPETLLAAALEHPGIRLQYTLAADFITLRMDGSTVPMSITTIDQIEYARSAPR